MTNVLSANIARCFGHYALLAANDASNEYTQAFDDSRFRCKIEYTGDQRSSNIEGAQLLNFSLEYIPFRASTLDVVLIDGRLARQADPLHCLREVTRVLMHGGRLMISDAERYSPARLLSFCRSLLGQGTLDDVNYSSYTLIKWLEVLGYDVSLMRKYPYDETVNSSWPAKWLAKLTDFSCRLGLWGGTEYAIIAVKREARITGTGAKNGYRQVANISHARVTPAKSFRKS